eukprot:889284-Pyramimonas_sp.AAC.1
MTGPPVMYPDLHPGSSLVWIVIRIERHGRTPTRRNSRKNILSRGFERIGTRKRNGRLRAPTPRSRRVRLG